ncbi:cytidylyltransferase domain-containing protein [Vogesella fluminis]|uniref:cytidylyltransferase domain-containing protein n=1 Tax=Vogesella fluminis TaxID=1069161 RepID=UPI0036457A89
MAHTIAAAKASGLFDRIVVSTDDEEIMAVAKAHGAEVPFRRPRALADDHTTTLDVIRHAIAMLGLPRRRCAAAFMRPRHCFVLKTCVPVTGS